MNVGDEMDRLFIEAIPLIEKIEESGYEAYFVGGSVRDSILNRTINDIDIATQATPEEIKAIFDVTFDVGIEHGTVLVCFNHQNFEVTTYRTESAYIDYRRPSSVQFIRSLYDDLQRRDFTMNAIAMDKLGNIIDPFKGKEAIEQKTIVTVGLPQDRFTEDALRMMRAIRFVSQLGFSIEVDTLQAIKQHAHLLNNIAMERIEMEMSKLLGGKHKKLALDLINTLELYEVFPSIIDQQSLQLIQSYDYSLLTEEEMWVLLLFTHGQFVEKELRMWRLSVKKIKYLKKAYDFLQKRMTRDWEVFDLYMAQEPIVIMVENIWNVLHRQTDEENKRKLIVQLNQLAIRHSSEVAVSGKELMDWRQQSGGPWIKDLLQQIERAIVEGSLQNEQEAIRRWIENENN